MKHVSLAKQGAFETVLRAAESGVLFTHTVPLHGGRMEVTCRKIGDSWAQLSSVKIFGNDPNRQPFDVLTRTTGESILPAAYVRTDIRGGVQFMNPDGFAELAVGAIDGEDNLQTLLHEIGHVVQIKDLDRGHHWADETSILRLVDHLYQKGIPVPVFLENAKTSFEEGGYKAFQRYISSYSESAWQKRMNFIELALNERDAVRRALSWLREIENETGVKLRDVYLAEDNRMRSLREDLERPLKVKETGPLYMRSLQCGKNIRALLQDIEKEDNSFGREVEMFLRGLLARVSFR